MNTEPLVTREWKTFSDHKQLMREREECFENAKQENRLYLPLLESTYKHIEDGCAQKQLDAAMALLSKCVYVLRGTTSTTPLFGGLILVECIGRSSDKGVCVYVGGPLMNEQGVIYEDLIVRVAVYAHTYISYR